MTVPLISSHGRKLALLAALLGWMFDGMEMGLFPLVGSDALRELLGEAAPQSEVDLWFKIALACFLVGAATGGVVFGWLGDKLGRVRAMTVSVLLYSICSGLSATAQTSEQLVVLRFLGALGMGGEWALGVALVMEIWPNRSRGWLAGWIGAFGNFGYTVCGLIAYGLKQTTPGELQQPLCMVGLPADWAVSLTTHGNWRLLMLVGAIPAVLTLLIRLFVPESEKWLRQKDAGTVSNWSERDLVGVLLGAAAACGVIVLWGPVSLDPAIRIAGSFLGLFVVVLGYLRPVRGYLSRCDLPPAIKRETLLRMLLAAGLSGVPLLGTWAGLMWMYQWVSKLPGGDLPTAKPILQIASSLGAGLGCVLAAWLCSGLGRRAVYAGLCVLSLISMFCFYRLNTAYGPLFIASSVVLGLVSAAFYGWLPLYLPELFRTPVRATGQGFGFNFGRIIAAAGNLQMSNLLAYFDNDYAQACSLVAGVYVVGLILIAFAPETNGQPLPE
jgi:MFS family permease